MKELDKKLGQRWYIVSNSGGKFIVEVISSEEFCLKYTGKWLGYTPCQVVQVFAPDRNFIYVVGKLLELSFDSDVWQYELLTGQEKPT